MVTFSLRLIRDQGRALSTSVFGLVDGLVGLDEDGRAFALHRDSGVVVEDVASLCEVTVPPHFQVGLASQA